MFTHNDCALDFRGRRSIFIRKPVDHHQQQHRLHCGLLYFIFFFFFILSCEGFLGFHSFDTAFFFFFSSLIRRRWDIPQNQKVLCFADCGVEAWRRSRPTRSCDGQKKKKAKARF